MHFHPPFHLPAVHRSTCVNQNSIEQKGNGNKLRAQNIARERAARVPRSQAISRQCTAAGLIFQEVEFYSYILYYDGSNERKREPVARCTQHRPLSTGMCSETSSFYRLAISVTFASPALPSPPPSPFSSSPWPVVTLQRLLPVCEECRIHVVRCGYYRRSAARLSSRARSMSVAP